MFYKFVLCSHKRIIGRDEYYGLVSCIRFGVGFSASLCCIKVIQIHVWPSNPSMLSIKKINISFYKTCFNTFLYQWWLNMCCITVKRITGVILCIIMKYKNLKVYDCIVSYVFKTMCWFSWEKLAFINQCKPVLVHMYPYMYQIACWMNTLRGLWGIWMGSIYTVHVFYIQGH